MHRSVIAAIEAIESRILMASGRAGRNDPDYATNGLASAGFGTNVDFGAMLVLNNDETEVVGRLASSGQIAIARFGKDGTLDPNFSGDGKTLITLPNAGTANHFSIDKSTGAVVAWDPSHQAVFNINGSGTLDSSFSTDGESDLPVNVVAAAMDQNGRVLVGQGSRVVRLNSSGAIDTKYGTASQSIGVAGDIQNIQITTDGRAVIESTATATGSVTKTITVLDDSGQLDKTFAAGAGSISFTHDSKTADDLTNAHILPNGDLAYGVLNSDPKTGTPRSFTMFVDDTGVAPASPIRLQSFPFTKISDIADVYVDIFGQPYLLINDTKASQDFTILRYSNAGLPDNSWGFQNNGVETTGKIIDYDRGNPKFDLMSDLAVVAGFSSGKALAATKLETVLGLSSSQLPAFTTGEDHLGTVLNIVGSPIGDNMTVTRLANGDIKVTDGSRSLTASAATLKFNHVRIYGDHGNDTITIENNIGRLTIMGQQGDDVIQGAEGNDFIDGNEGDDTLRGGTGNDTVGDDFGSNDIEGQGGNDLLDAQGDASTLLGGKGNDTIDADGGFLDGGSDSDQINILDEFPNAHVTISYSFSTKPVRLAVDGNRIGSVSENDRIKGIRPDIQWTLIGSSFSDTIIGTDGNDTIQANGGNDSISAGAGNDSVSGGNGNDTIDGGDGNDTLIGGAGNDLIHGGASADSISGNGGDDHLFGDGGNDHINGGPGHDDLHGGAGNDLLNSKDGVVDSLFGDGGHDSAIADDIDSLASVESTT